MMNHAEDAAQTLTKAHGKLGVPAPTLEEADNRDSEGSAIMASGKQLEAGKVDA